MRRGLLALGMGTLGLVALAVDWPLGGHDPGRSSAVPERISPPLEVTWSVTLHLEPEELVAAAGTVIAVGSGAVVALDLGTGEEKWRYRVPGVRGSFRSCPAIWGDLVLVGGQLSDTLWALELATGEVSWHYPGFENLYADLCVSGDLLLVGDPSGLVALEASTGERVWQAEAVPAGSPAAAEGGGAPCCGRKRPWRPSPSPPGRPPGGPTGPGEGAPLTRWWRETCWPW